MLGIMCKYECPACGNILKINSPFWNKDLRKKVSEPTKCGCGRKNNFNLIGFEQCSYEIIPDGYQIVEKEVK